MQGYVKIKVSKDDAEFFKARLDDTRAFLKEHKGDLRKIEKFNEYIQVRRFGFLWKINKYKKHFRFWMAYDTIYAEYDQNLLRVDLEYYCKYTGPRFYTTNRMFNLEKIEALINVDLNILLDNELVQIYYDQIHNRLNNDYTKKEKFFRPDSYFSYFAEKYIAKRIANEVE